MHFLDTYRPQVLAAGRIAFGSLFAMHGLRHSFGMFGGSPGEMPAAAGLVIGAFELYSWAFLMIASVRNWTWALEPGPSAATEPGVSS